MKNLITSTALVLAMATTASAGSLFGPSQGQAQNQGQAQGQVQGQAQGQGQGQLQSNRNFVDSSTPSFTYGIYASLSSMANDRCGRVVAGIPFSAHTCNILMEAEALFLGLEPIYGEVFAAEAYLSHVGTNDRTMRKTLKRMGLGG